MVIPWTLLATVVAAAAPALWWAGRRARARGLDRGAPADVAFTIGLVALVTARFVTLALDTALLGALPDLRAALTLGAGLSVPGAVLGGLLAGAWLSRRGRMTDSLWAASIPPAAAGLALWSALAVVRGEVGAPIPVALLEAVAFAVAAVWLARTALAGSRLGAAFAAVAAGVHLLGGLLRPQAATVDADVDVLLGLLALGLAAAVAAGLGRRLVRSAALAAAVLVVGAGTVAGIVAAPVQPTAAASPLADAWGPEELDAFVSDEGRPVVVNFWASWCPPCHAEAPALARTARALADEAAFVGVLIDDDPDRARAFVDRYGLPFPTVADGGLRHSLGMVGLPTTVILTADGSVSRRLIGGLDARSLTAAVRAAQS
jgi:thiol-disulfide isomerase/thioredoxin